MSRARISVFVGLLVAPGLPGGASAQEHRAYDGSGNNVAHPVWGQAGTMLIRGASGAHYTDGIGGMIDRANPRAVSNAVSAQTAPVGNARLLSSFHWQWGQFIDHDFALVSEGGAESAPIPIPTGDPFFDPGHTGTQTMPFSRSLYADGVTTPRRHANVITHWIDASMVYGSDSARADALRTHSGGRLATSAGDLLPYNTGGLPNAPSPSPDFFVAGDVRANEQSGLTMIHTVFVREHNHWADRLAAENPGWTDEQVYQQARRIVGAEVQAVTYNEWLPALLGPQGPGAYSGYDAGIEPTLNSVFSSAAFRVGHTMLNDQLLRLNADGSVFAGGHLSLAQAFFNPGTITEPGSLDALIRGFAAQESNEIDTQAIDSVRNLLFGPPGSPGRDLIAINIQRGRDHGIPDYNTLREDFGLARVTGFSDITADPALAAALQSVYGSVNGVDAWIGLMAEDHLPGSSVGETIAAIFRDQFLRLREADRFFYLNDPDLSADLVAEIDATPLSDILMRNSAVMGLRQNVFFVPAPPALLLAFGAGGFAAARRPRR